MLITVGGQTASGKSALAVELAHRLGGAAAAAIVSVDSMQLYRGLDVGTAKISDEETRGIEHFQLDELEVAQEASVAVYQQRARGNVETLLGENRTPIAVGGTGLYMRALIDEMEFPATDPQVRERWQQMLNEEGAPALHQQLARLDPAAAEQIHPNNGRRLVRALEAIEVTGRPFSATLPQYVYHYEPTIQFAIRWSNDELDQRIAERTEMMFRPGGIVAETETILASGQQFGKTAARATGYAEALAVLAGTMTVTEAIDQVQLATRQLSRRQMKWFRRDPRIKWLEGDSLPRLADLAMETISRVAQ